MSIPDTAAEFLSKSKAQSAASAMRHDASQADLSKARAEARQRQALGMTARPSFRFLDQISQ